MTFKISVFNASNYERGGYVSLPWQQVHKRTGIDQKEFLLIDEKGNPLLTQIDEVDPSDESRTTLSFLLAEPIPPGLEDYSTPTAFVEIKKGRPLLQSEDLPCVNIEDKSDKLMRGVLLDNSILAVFINLTASPGDKELIWYAGSATSVRLDEKEILDSIKPDWIDHDSEKRCMQLDQIKFPRPAWETKIFQQVQLYDRKYELIAKSSGAIRACITIATEPFDYQYFDPFEHKQRHLECRLNRVISLYTETDYVKEELFVKGTVKNKRKRPEVVELMFTARYFMSMNFGFEPDIYQFPHVMDWFAIGSRWSPCPGYGFATDVHASPIAYPHQDPDYTEIKNNYKTFSWELLPSKSANCIHQFGFNDYSRLDSKTGHTWYEMIYKPLKAKIQ